MSTTVDRAQQREREDRAARGAAAAFLVAIAAAIGLFVVYLSGGHTQGEGALLFVAFGGIGVGLGIWAKVLLPEPELVEDRPPLHSTAEERAEFVKVYGGSAGQSRSPRRRFLVRLLAGAGTSLGLALLLPFRSLGPGPESELFRTSWREGEHLVTAEGERIRAADVVADEIVTVFPESATTPEQRADSQAVLIGLRAERMALPEGSPPTVEQLVVYSKICTHAGCPVGLYRAAVGELLCPCHQSTFDVNEGARVRSGPAGRPLPQLPLGTDDDGFLISLGDFEGPVGPAFWNMSDRPGSDA
ncbi:MAG: ubiquinol-cytochrome c reductase iron-sulfur subunit [Actinobacteria bacterium]|nr:ubiquinol-cytochrome c reductase iron-sulfur subunit [Actinomycetota bacterium]